MTIEENSNTPSQTFVDDWKARYSNRPIPRPRFMTVADYVFYLRRHLSAEQRKNDPNVGFPGDESMQIGIPKLPYLLKRLEDDIRSSYTSFVEEFVSDAHNGTGCLLDLLRTCHNRPSESGLFPYGTCVRRRQNLINMRMIDELYCLLCLKAASKSAAAVYKMTVHKNGIFTLASCIMSYHMKSRVLAIELLTAVCKVPETGVSGVLEAMTAVRMIFGESVRFKCLVSILNSSFPTSSSFEITTMNFLNTLLENCLRVAERIRIQCELEEAGLDVRVLEKDILQRVTDVNRDRVWCEIQRFNRLHLDLKNALQEREENVKLKKEVMLLRKACKKLQEEKRELMSTSKELQGLSSSKEAVEHRGKFDALGKVENMVLPDVAVNPGIQDSELEEIFIDIPTITPAANVHVKEPRNRSNESRPLPTPPIQKHSDSGISSIWGSDADIDLGLGWQYPEIPTLKLVKRQSSVHVRFSNDTSVGPSRCSTLVGREHSDVLVLPPGRNKTKYADVNGVAKSANETHHAKGHPEPKKTTSRSAASSKKEEKRRLDLAKIKYGLDPPKSASHSLKIYSRQVSQSAKTSKGPYTLTQAPIGSSLSGMIHREIARAIRDRTALFQI